MTNHRMRSRAVWVLASWMLVSAPAVAFAQDAFTRAKGFYASAEYEEALSLLEALKGRSPNAEVAAYEVFCLVALGRAEEAKSAIEAIVRRDPLFRPSEAQASPRVRGFFEDVRRPMLPDLVRQMYAKAKSSYEGKAWQDALGEFDRVIALVDEIVETEPGVADVRILAIGFRDLTKAALAPPPPPPPAPEPPAPAPPPVAATMAVPAEPDVYGGEHPNVKKPVVLSQPMPPWRPENPTEERASYNGAVELLVGEDGKVVSVKLLESVHPRFDAPLLEMAKSWTFRPATKDGTPVKYRYAVGIKLGR